MRLIISFNDELAIGIENISHIVNEGEFIRLNGALITIVVNAFNISSTSEILINKNWLFAAEEVYFDTRIEEAKSYGKDSTSNL